MSRTLVLMILCSSSASVAGDGELGGLFGIKAGTTGSPWRTCQGKVGLVYVCTYG